MNGPIIQTDVEERLIELADRLDNETENFGDIAHARALAEVAYKKEYATCMLQNEGTVANRESIATIHCAELLQSWKIKEAQEKAQQQLLIAIRNQLDAFRTISANVRSSGA